MVYFKWENLMDKLPSQKAVSKGALNSASLLLYGYVNNIIFVSLPLRQRPSSAWTGQGSLGWTKGSASGLCQEAKPPGPNFAELRSRETELGKKDASTTLRNVIVQLKFRFILLQGVHRHGKKHHLLRRRRHPRRRRPPGVHPRLCRPGHPFRPGKGPPLLPLYRPQRRRTLPLHPRRRLRRGDRRRRQLCPDWGPDALPPCDRRGIAAALAGLFRQPRL